MDANELRALADALSSGTHFVESPELHEAMIRAAAYLRAQADAHPAPDVPAGWKLVPVEPTGLMVDAGREAMQRAPDLGGIVSANTAEVMDSYTAMLAAAPAVPQAEPKRELTAGEHDVLDSALRSSVKLVARGVAEPKREPSDESITKGEYVLATKWSDGDPGDHWGVGFYDRLENGRHYIVDRAGQQIRGNGFRRAGRITMDVGIWLLSAAKSLEASPPGTVNLWTMLTERAHGIGGSDE